MAKVNGMQEKLHWPLYDAFRVSNGGQTFVNAMTDPRVIRFFVDIQNKTKLETNLQAAGVLPSLNSYEARSMRVVCSGVKETKPPAKDSTDADFLYDLIYNSVTSLLVGEKIMIEVPTFWFPAGAGVSPGAARISNHGEPDPMATFRFAEPVFIESQQNFRVEMSFPRGLGDLESFKGPFHIWVVLDGYLTRDVQ